jgi:hypothetical protein
MNSVIQFIVAIVVLAVGEYIIYKVAMSLDMPAVFQWLFILVIPIVVVAGIIIRLRD